MGSVRQTTGLNMNYLRDDEIKLLKAAFLLYSNGKPTLTADDLKNTMRKLDMAPKNDQVAAMLKEAGGSSITADAFVTMMGKKIKAMDSERVIKDAFSSFDALGRGVITTDDFKKVLTEIGSPDFADAEVREILRAAKPDDNAKIDYVAFTDMMTGEKDKTAAE